jgi:hypothetical protein
MRDDKKYRLKIDESLYQINVRPPYIQGEVRKLAQEKAREEERKEHPK